MHAITNLTLNSFTQNNMSQFLQDSEQIQQYYISYNVFYYNQGQTEIQRNYKNVCHFKYCHKFKNALKKLCSTIWTK